MNMHTFADTFVLKLTMCKCYHIEGKQKDNSTSSARSQKYHITFQNKD